jgi:flagellar biosynthesis protein FlhA
LSVRDIGFALGIMLIICVLFLPIPPFLIDIGLAFSIALSVLILMVALWIQRPLDFSSFPTVLLIATMTAAVAQHRDDARDPVARQRGA